ncbi:hypothetical protein C8035_v007787 [Colletotrichum spinosum]|uniref:Uncharacterized protein n=1 Tax=Colletotrichum spinosum TaxID=1347390 RepID=A0A4R8QGR1_9PEZI|nr:hypothetical protein C8035_v007787 [Colletotrichum spinosum]
MLGAGGLSFMGSRIVSLRELHRFDRRWLPSPGPKAYRLCYFYRPTLTSRSSFGDVGRHRGGHPSRTWRAPWDEFVDGRRAWIPILSHQHVQAKLNLGSQRVTDHYPERRPIDLQLKMEARAENPA